MKLEFVSCPLCLLPMYCLPIHVHNTACRLNAFATSTDWMNPQILWQSPLFINCITVSPVIRMHVHLRVGIRKCNSVSCVAVKIFKIWNQSSLRLNMYLQIVWCTCWLKWLSFIFPTVYCTLTVFSMVAISSSILYILNNFSYYTQFSLSKLRRGCVLVGEWKKCCISFRKRKKIISPHNMYANYLITH